jgi:hypothetical protein
MTKPSGCVSWLTIASASAPSFARSTKCPMLFSVNSMARREMASFSATRMVVVGSFFTSRVSIDISSACPPEKGRASPNLGLYVDLAGDQG